MFQQRKAQTLGLPLDHFKNILLAVLIVMLVFAVSYRMFDDTAIYHTHATKSLSLDIDTVSSLTSDTLIVEHFIDLIRIRASTDTLSVQRVQEEKLLDKKTVFALREAQTLTVDDAASSVWYVSRAGSEVSVTATLPNIVPTPVCPRMQLNSLTWYAPESLSSLTPSIQVLVGAQRVTEELFLAGHALEFVVDDDAMDTITLYVGSEMEQLGCSMAAGLAEQGIPVQVVPLTYSHNSAQRVVVYGSLLTYVQPAFSNALAGGLLYHAS